MGKGVLNLIFTLSLSLYIVCTSGVPTVQEYLKQRSQVFQDEDSVKLGSNQILEDIRELKVNEILMKYKSREYEEGLDSNGVHFAAAQHFFHTKPLIEASNVYKIIKLLPKGAALHMHDPTVPSAEFVVKHLTYMDNLYYCVNEKEKLSFRFYENPPAQGCSPTAQWRLVSDLRNSSSSEEFVNRRFEESMSLYTPQPAMDYPNINVVWSIFEDKITTLSGVSNYVPALRKYFYQTLKDFYDDNVMYIEMRGLLINVYNLDQSEPSSIELLGIYEEVTKEFIKDYPDFWGAKYIFAPHRFQTPQDISKRINEAVEMKAQYPDFFAGFDLVGQEDIGRPILDFLPQLLDAASKDIKFFFHAGETAWHGTKIDENLVDAILLNTTRIGHAYALASHPFLADIVQQKGIAVESCPISNQVLKLVEDYRNHPAIALMKDGFPLVVSCDDPGLWGATALSHDWYMAFMAMAGGHADLRFLKQLAINSIQYSAMNSTEKTAAFTKWYNLWSEFLDNVIELYSSDTNHCNATKSDISKADVPECNPESGGTDNSIE